MSYQFDFDRPIPATARPNPEAAIRQAKQLLANAGVKADIVIRTPQWKPGDVVVLRYGGPSSQPYTYVRGVNKWPGERIDKTDAQMSEGYAAGMVIPVLQSGGVPFAVSRLR